MIPETSAAKSPAFVTNAVVQVRTVHVEVHGMVDAAADCLFNGHSSFVDLTDQGMNWYLRWTAVRCTQLGVSSQHTHWLLNGGNTPLMEDDLPIPVHVCCYTLHKNGQAYEDPRFMDRVHKHPHRKASRRLRSSNLTFIHCFRADRSSCAFDGILIFIGKVNAKVPCKSVEPILLRFEVPC